ncbi:MAG: transposase [Alphaproteobacteria bacterium]|nr:transposase [Alphaproteobacteria bacterium]
MPLADGTEAVRFTPEELVERLAALVPPPRAHLVSYHGVLAGRSAWRSEVVPDPPVTVAAVDESALTPSGRVRRRYYRTWASSVWRETRFVYRTRPVRNVGLRQAHRSEG